MFFGNNPLGDLTSIEQTFLIFLTIKLLLHFNSIGPGFFSVRLTQEKRVELLKLLNEAHDLVAEFFYCGPKLWDCKILYLLLSSVFLIAFLDFYLPAKFTGLYFMFVFLMSVYIFYKTKLSWYK
jgi:hypothetical protein